MISLVQVYWKIKGFQGSRRMSPKKGSDLVVCRSNNIANDAESYIDASGQGATTKVIDKKSKTVKISSFECAYWTFDNVDYFELVEEKELRCYRDWNESFNDINYGKAIKELYDKKELLHDRDKYLDV